MTKSERKLIRQTEKLIRSTLAASGYPVLKGASAQQAIRAAMDFEAARAAQVNAVIAVLQAQVAANGECLRTLNGDFDRASAAVVAEAEALIKAAAYGAQ